MQQLIRITTVPIKYEVHSEPARLEMDVSHKSTAPATYSMQQRNARINLRAQNIQMRMDSYEMRKSLGLKNIRIWPQTTRKKGASRFKSSPRNTCRLANSSPVLTREWTLAKLCSRKPWNSQPTTRPFCQTAGD